MLWGGGGGGGGFKCFYLNASLFQKELSDF